MATATSWTLAVKTVGEQSDFIITVSPEDDLTSMNNQIEECTGLKPTQQRLIYRGRIIRGGGGAEPDSLKSEPKVKDVVGLADGQTIHLVPRPEETTTISEPVERPERELGAATTSTRSGPPPESETSSAGTAALLAALLGLGAMDDVENSEENVSLGQQLARLRSARIRNRSRRPNYRLTPSDLELPDPGSMEPVRQGLLTLHTMLEGNPLHNTEGRVQNRQWYRGQWIDCRDTVNQWLEATVVEVVKPEDILPVQLEANDGNQCTTRVVHPTTDPAVSANDVEGRMRLLLEPADCSPPLDGEWTGFQQRDNNEGVKLLLLHYNGWPHRWDEWIRSDSERIRPFRTRTRHPNASSTACPTPQSTLADTPATNIKSEIESEDRAALLPELQRVFGAVTDLLEQSVEKEITNEPAKHYTPWIGGGISLEDEIPDLLSDAECEIESHRPLLSDESIPAVRSDDEAKDEEHSMPVTQVASPTNPNLKRQLQTLIPLLDRLGRTLTDAAPHLAAYAASLPDEPAREPERTAPGESNVVIAREVAEELAPPERRSGLFSLLPVGGRSSGPPVVAPADVAVVSDDDEEVIAPDYIDFVSGVVNTTRGEVRSRGSRSSSDEAGLLGAYLTAASLGSLGGDDDGNEGGGLQGLGRLIRQRETNGSTGGGGIDIHIHAIVTGPAVGNGTMAIIGDPQISAPRPALFTSDSRRSGFAEPRISLSAPVDEEELGIFSDLYSENPTPVDLQNGVLPAEIERIDIASPDPVDEIDSLASDGRAPRHNSLRSESPSRSPRHRGSGSRELPLFAPTRRGGPVSRLLRRLSRRSLADPDRSFRDL